MIQNDALPMAAAECGMVMLIRDEPAGYLLLAPSQEKRYMCCERPRVSQVNSPSTALRATLTRVSTSDATGLPMQVALWRRVLSRAPATRQIQNPTSLPRSVNQVDKLTRQCTELANVP